MEESPQSTQAECLLSGFRKRKSMAWIAGVLLALLLIVVFLVAISFIIVRHLYESAPDSIVSYQVDRTIEAAVPSWSPVQVAANQTIPVRLSKTLEADLPFKQDVNIWIDKDFTVPLDVTIPIPIDQEIFVEAEVPVETEIKFDKVRVHTSLLGFDNISLPVSGSFPVNIMIPFKGPIHVKTQTNVHVQQEVNFHVKRMFTFPLDIKAHVSLPVDDVFEVSFPDTVTVNARVPERMPVDVHTTLELSKKGLLLPDRFRDSETQP